MKIRRQQITGGLLTILFVFYFAGVSFFSHAHVDEFNRLIVHSHPFSSESHHQHSSVNFLTIDKLQHFTVSLFLFAFSFIAFYKLSIVVTDSYRKVFSLSTFTPFCFSRPPPAI
jgi:hypothetical protein